jgi:pimeloyl-ACP methyl ester carboxylesterase/class 3 adenylate cyclase
MAELEIRYCTTSDGVRIAYGTVGHGFPVVNVPLWVTHIGTLKGLPDPGPFQVVHYDKRGTGLSDRNLGDYSIKTRLRDLEAVIEAAVGDGAFALSGNSEGGPLAIAYAAANPERVSRLIVDGGFAVGDRDDKDRETRAAVVALVKADWGMGSAALTSLFWDDNATKDMLDWWRYVQHEAVTAEDAAAMWEANGRVDVRELLPLITCPTLVIHGRNDRAVPFDRGRELASSIRGARLVSDDGGHAGEHLNRGVAQLQFLLEDEHVAGWRPPAPPAEPASAEPAVDLTPGIRYATSADGTRIAYEVYGGGAGVPLVLVSAWWAITTLGPFRVPVIDALNDGRPVVPYARRGIGASQRDVSDVSFEAQVADLGAIIDHLGVEPVDVLAVSDGASIALAYAARNTHRVRRLVLWGAFSRGSEFVRPESARRLATLIRTDWALARRNMATAVGSSVPVAGNALRQTAAVLRDAMSQETAAQYIEAIAALDVSAELNDVDLPVLALHRRNDTYDPFVAGQSVAAALPNARFVAIDGDDPMWSQEEKLISYLMIEFLDGIRPPSPAAAAAPAPPVEPVTDAPPRVRYARTRDGVDIAYYAVGRGKAVVMMGPPPFRHILHQWEGDKQLAAILEQHDRTLVQFDARGLGSSSIPEDFSPDAYTGDLEAVVDHLNLDAFDLQATTYASPIAIAYAVKHPDRVSHLALEMPFMRGREALDSEVGRAVRALREQDWDLYTETVMYLISRFDKEAAQQSAALLRAAATPDTARRTYEAVDQFDVSGLLSSMRVPTLVTYRTNWALIPIEQSRRVAAEIPGAKFVTVTSAQEFLVETGAFFGILEPSEVEALRSAAEQAPSRHAATAQHGTAIILFADIVDSTGLTERIGDSAFRERSRELEARLRAAIVESGGTAVEGRTLGDGVLATFPAARQAIESALRCSEEGASVDLPLHLGIHAGDVIREKNTDGRDDIHGGAVNVAARISALSEGGEVLVSDIVRGLGRTSADVAFADRGEQSLKGVSEPVRVYAVRPKGDD